MMTPKQSIHPSVMAVIMLIMTVRVTVICSPTSPSLFHALSILTVMKGRRPTMNPLNYTSLEASKRLVDAGIVLETEALWVKWYFDSSTNMNYHPYEWRLMYRGLTQDDLKSIPAPSMAEVWRELPDVMAMNHRNGETECWLETGSDSFASTNPTDALIDLLIWVRKENNAS